VLLQFEAENFLSIASRAGISMRASSAGDAQAPDPTLLRVSPRLDVLRCGALYGANASGKSNLIAAMAFAQSLITAPPSTRDAPIPTSPFRFGRDGSEKPSVFEFYLLIDRRVFGYRVAVSRREVVEEHLSEAPLDDPGQERVVFSRAGAEFELGAALSTGTDPGFIEYIARGTRANQPFLNEAHERSLAVLEPVYQWFASTLVIIAPHTRYGPLVEEADQEPAFRDFLGSVLEWADTGIVGVETRRSELQESVKKELESFRRSKRVRELLRHFQPRVATRDTLIERPEGPTEVLSLHFKHRAGDPADVQLFDVEDESDGTMRLLDLAPMLYRSSHAAQVYVVDEIDRSLHTLLAQRLIERFIGDASRIVGVTAPQLLFTTHDTNLLDCRRLRPDGVWFAEKRRDGASQFYSLAEFKPEQLVAQRGELERGYLQGRFGAIPFIGDPRRLHWPTHDPSK
jgi:uncharacterized protein